ncbi:MAG TPA: radical SAM protein, partial [Longimicrobiaceae bacterium]|nr:radical SAM protein [Longimicrobiaceae bacterium]
DRTIFVKQSADEVARTVLRHPGRAVVLGTATDPYQPAERRFRVTRGVLEALSRLEGLEVSITTKSPLVTRDLDLLLRIAERSRITVHLSLTTVDRGLLRVLEPRAPTPEKRLDALRELRGHGIRAGIFAMPLLPGITDTEEQIDAVYAAARAADACFVVAGGVRLSDTSWRRFLPVLRALRPDLVDAYQTIVRRRASPQKRRYKAKLDARIARCRARHGYDRSGGFREHRMQREAQLTLL